MFADPQSVTLNSVAVSLPRIKIGDQNATYKSADGTAQLRISHQPTKGRIRRMIRLDLTKIAEDPLTAVNQAVSAGVYFVVDAPANGVFSGSDLSDLYTALSTFINASSYAAWQKLLGGES